MNGFKLRVLMNEKNLSSRTLADKLGISYNRLNRKLDGEAEFTANEINLLGNELGRREVGFIFFN